MSRIAYVNGRYKPIHKASVGIEDRGFQFGDGVYEGVSVYRGQMVDLDPHLDRLDRSLGELSMPAPMGRRALVQIFRTVILKNRVRDGFLYVQVTRGEAPRDHAFPASVRPSLVVTCRRFDFGAIRARAETGVSVLTQPDQRWGRCDIKSIQLLPNCAAKTAARDAGAFEAVLLDREGYITEGSSTNMWIVKDGALITRSTDDNILSGITRASLMGLAQKRQIRIEERRFTPQDAVEAQEMFLTSSTGGVTAITTLDNSPIGTGTVGPVSLALIDAYWAHMAQAPD